MGLLRPVAPVTMYIEGEILKIGDSSEKGDNHNESITKQDSSYLVDRK